MKAMLLAAGRGERMRPLTDKLPKPLIPVGSKALIEHNLEKLKQAGITEVVINVSYCAKQIIDRIGNGERFGIKITYSYEPDAPLGTGGGIFQALKFLGNAPFLVLSSDVWTDYPFEQLLQQPKGEGHLILVENPDFHPDGDFCLLETGQVSSKQSPKLTYANIAVIHPRLFKSCQSGAYALAPLLEKAMTRSAVTGEVYRGQWYNVGTPKELEKLQKILR